MMPTRWVTLSYVSFLVSISAFLAHENRLMAATAQSFRPGNLVDYLMSHPSTDKSTMTIQLEILWSVVIDGLAEVWPPTRTKIKGISLGDVWPCETLRSRHAPNDSTDHLVPFHKLSQWLTYSLIEPLNKVLGVTFANVEVLTGLPEYRNGEGSSLVKTA
jgi:hypothetical protein